MVADGNQVQAQGVGSAWVTSSVDGVLKQWELGDCLYVPSMHANLISIGQLGDQFNTPITMLQKGKRCDLFVGNEKVAVAATDLGVPMMDSYTLAESACEKPAMVSAIAVTKSAMKATMQPTHMQQLEAQLWHRRYGHLSMSSLAKLVGIVKGISTTASAFIADPLCVPCIEAKMARAPFTSSDVASSPGTLHLLHMDLSGPYEPPSIGGAKYVATFTDDYSKWSEVRLLQHKSGLPAAFQSVVLLLENQLGKSLKAIRTDRGGEFVNCKMEEFLSSKGILHQKTVPYSPQQNGVAERMNRTLAERTRAMLCDTGLPKKFWGEPNADCLLPYEFVTSSWDQHNAF
jgi:hypothetical protein